jgi:hypothetical protein
VQPHNISQAKTLKKQTITLKRKSLKCSNF